MNQIKEFIGLLDSILEIDLLKKHKEGTVYLDDADVKELQLLKTYLQKVKDVGEVDVKKIDGFVCGATHIEDVAPKVFDLFTKKIADVVAENLKLKRGYSAKNLLYNLQEKEIKQLKKEVGELRKTFAKFAISKGCSFTRI